MLYQLSYDHHEAMKCATPAAKFHHHFPPLRWSSCVRVALASDLVTTDSVVS